MKKDLMVYIIAGAFVLVIVLGLLTLMIFEKTRKFAKQEIKEIIDETFFNGIAKAINVGWLEQTRAAGS